MAKRAVLTNAGIELLATSSRQSGTHYWIGFWIPAYVPNLWKKHPVELPSTDCNEIAEQYNDQLITEEDSDLVTPDSTKLTNFGDVIYNIWGSIDPTGKEYLFDSTIDASFIKKNYRYVFLLLQPNGNITNMGAGNKIADSVEDLKRPYGMGNGYIVKKK